jgi:transposase
VIPRRRVVERTFGWLMHHRRLACDYETHSHRSEVIIHVAMIDLMSRRLTRESTPNWRNT